jgi:hypothetical protein
MTGISIAARYRSATREASVGGDLYETIPTGHGILYRSNTRLSG